MIPRNHSFELVFFISHLKHRNAANNTHGRGEMMQNLTPVLFHTPCMILLLLS